MNRIRQKFAAFRSSTLPRVLTGLAFTALMAMTFSVSVNAETSHQQIESAFAKAIGQLMVEQGLVTSAEQRASYEINALDPRLQLASCTKELNVSLKYQRLPGRVTGKISCEGNQPWIIYSSADIELYQSVVVAAEPLARAARIEEGQLMLVEKEVSELRQGFYSHIDEVSGLETKRSLAYHAVVAPALLIEPVAVQKGEEVVIEARQGSLSVRSTGTAMANGRIGQRINVRNSSSDRIIRVQVVAKGRVEVIL